jgi:spore coat protein CotH
LPPPQVTDALFKDDELNDIHFTMDPADWESIIWDTMGDTYRKATFQWKEITLQEVGVQPSGSSSRYPGNQKMSLRLDFNQFIQGQKFLGLKDLKLDGMREGTLIKERLAYGVYRARLRCVPRTVHCKVYVNGEYRGVYLVEERVTGTLIRDRYRVAEAGNLYRLRVDDPEAFTWRGSDPSLYQPEPWQPETNELTGDHTVIPRFLDILNHRPADVATVCDLENLADYLACETAVISRDGILRNAGPPHNAFEYHRPETGLFELVPWDVDQCLFSAEASRDLWHNFENSALTRLVRDTPALNDLYRRKIEEILEAVTRPDLIAARIDFIYNQIKDAAHADIYKHRSNDDFDGYPASLKRTFQLRYDNLKAQLRP